jgi:hypothetical protein
MKKQIMNKMPRASSGRLLALAPQHTNITDKRSQAPSANNKVSIAGKEPGLFNPDIDTLEDKSMLETEARGRGEGRKDWQGGEGGHGSLQCIGVNSAENQQSNSKQRVKKSQEDSQPATSVLQRALFTEAHLCTRMWQSNKLGPPEKRTTRKSGV